MGSMRNRNSELLSHDPNKLAIPERNANVLQNLCCTVNVEKLWRTTRAILQIAKDHKTDKFEVQSSIEDRVGILLRWHLLRGSMAIRSQHERRSLADQMLQSEMLSRHLCPLTVRGIRLYRHHITIARVMSPALATTRSSSRRPVCEAASLVNQQQRSQYMHIHGPFNYDTAKRRPSGHFNRRPC